MSKRPKLPKPPKPEELFAKAKSDMENAKSAEDIDSIDRAAEQFRLVITMYRRTNDYDKMAECYDEAGNGYMIIAELCKKTPKHLKCHDLSFFYTKAALMFSESATLYKLANKYEKSGEVLAKLIETLREQLNVLEKTNPVQLKHEKPDIEKKIHKTFKELKMDFIEDYAMKNGNIRGPHLGWKGASPENSPKAKSKSRSKSKSKSKTPNSPKSKRRTRRA